MGDIKKVAARCQLLTPHEIINIFEDFRQERVLNGFFINTDFVENVFLVNQVNKNIVELAQHYQQNPFYTICRFNYGPKKFIDKRNAIYEKYKDIDATNKNNNYILEAYYRDVYEFYFEVIQDFLIMQDQQNQNQQNQNQKQQGDGNGEDGQNNGSQQQDTDNEDETSGQNSSDKDEEQDGQNNGEGSSENDTQDGNPDGESDPGEAEILEEQDTQKSSGQASKEKGALGDKLKALANTIIFGSDQSYVSIITSTIEERKKQLVAEGNKVALGYSGKINARAFARPNNNDWKVFKREGGRQMGGGNKKLFINFFIDASRSYRKNVEETEKIINSFKLASKNGEVFEMDVYILDKFIHHTNKAYEAMKYNCNCWSAINTIDIRNVINKISHSKYDVVNIVLVDGIVDLNGGAKLLDRTDIIFIADTRCGYHFDRWFPNAIRHYIDSNYPAKLFKETMIMIKRKVN